MTDKKDILTEKEIITISPNGGQAVLLAILILVFFVIFSVIRIRMSGRVADYTIRIAAAEDSIRGKRGAILASNGDMLAVSTYLYDLSIDPQVSALRLVNDKDTTARRRLEVETNRKALKKDIPKLAKQLSGFLKDRSSRYYLKKLTKIYDKNSRPVRITNRYVTWHELQKIKEFAVFNKGRYASGFVVSPIEVRSCPYNFYLKRTIGELASNSPRPKGKSGIEESFNSDLSGKYGVVQKRKGAGEQIKENIVEAVNGYDVVTTIDVLIQDVAERALAEQLIESRADWGSAIVMDVKTGDILAMANSARSGDRIKEARFNYSVGDYGSVDPGSTFKLASAIVALESGMIDTLKRYDCLNGIWKYRNRRIKDSDWRKGGHREYSFEKIFIKSSNIGTAKFILNIFGNDYEGYYDGLAKLKLTDKIDLPIKGMNTPGIRNPRKEKWSATTLPWMAHGYGLDVTPLQTLTLYSAVANGGKMMEPRLVKELRRGDQVVKEFTPKVRVESICSQQNLNLIQKMMEGVVERGTARNIKSPDYKIAGKTGTAEIYDEKRGGYLDGQYYASFAGYMPADNPQFACIVFVKRPTVGLRYGGSVAGPVFRKIADVLHVSRLKNKSIDSFMENRAISYRNIVPSNGNLEDLKSVITPLGLELDMSNSDTESRSDVKSRSGSEGIVVEDRDIEIGIVPNLKGLSAKDAITTLERAGLNAKVIGRGVVVKQSRPEGTEMNSGVITLYLKNRG